VGGAGIDSDGDDLGTGCGERDPAPVAEREVIRGRFAGWSSTASKIASLSLIHNAYPDADLCAQEDVSRTREREARECQGERLSFPRT
jgi:hypothetical protein